MPEPRSTDAVRPDFAPNEQAAIAALRLAGLDAEIIETEGIEQVGDLSSPRQGDIIKPSDVVGHLLIVRPIEFLPEFQTSNGARDAVRVDVADLNANTDGGEWGVVYRDALWFGRVLVSGLRRQMGELILGWMAQGIGKPGQNPPFMLTDAMSNVDAVKVAQQWLNTHPEFEAVSNTQSPAAAPSSGPPAQAQQMPLPGAPGPAQAPAQVPLGTGGALGATAHPVPAAPAAPTPAQPAAPATLPVPNGQPANALAGLSETQKEALKALGFPVG